MEFLKIIFEFIAAGGSGAIISILMGVIGLLIYDRRSITKSLTETNNKLAETTLKVYAAKDSETQSIKEIVNRYYQGNLDLVQALNEIKIVLITIQNSKK